LDEAGRLLDLFEFAVERGAVEDLAGVVSRNSWSWIQKSA
jgi:hypothetical protein